MNAEVRPIRTAAETSLAAAVESARAALPGGEGVRTARERAWSAIAAAGLPHRRLEPWKYTDLRTLLREFRPLAARPDAAAIEAARSLVPGEFAALRLVLVNGAFVPELSSAEFPAGLSVASLGAELASGRLALAEFDGAPERGFIHALNTALTTDGIVLRAAPGAKVETPVHVASIQVGPAALASTRVIVHVAEDAELTLVESFGGDGAAHQATSVVEAEVASRGTLRHVKLQALGLQAASLATLLVRMGAESTFDHVAMATGAAVARQELGITFTGAQANARMHGITLGGSRRHLDTTLVIDHRAPGCASRELFKAVLDGEARAVFQGKIIVEPVAQKTDARMMAKALMLAEGPEADLKPELEIFADDVQCGHGATAGTIDEELLFYLRSRGVPEAEAQALLVQAFLGEVIEAVEPEDLREALLSRAVHWLGHRE